MMPIRLLKQVKRCLQACWVVILLIAGPPSRTTAQTPPVPPAPLIRDAGFGSGPTNVGTQFTFAQPFDMVRQADGKRIVVGQSCAVAGSSLRLSDCPNIVLARYQANGRLDTGFGNNNNGIVQFDEFAQTHPEFYALEHGDNGGLVGFALQSSGKALVGWRGGPYKNILALARLNADGSPDASFGVHGIVTQTTIFRPAYIAVQSDDRIVVGSGYDLQLNRLNSDGTSDTRFGTNGVVTSSVLSLPRQIFIQADDRIVVVADQHIGRFLADGTPDLEFGVQGVTENLCDSGCGWSRLVQRVNDQLYLLDAHFPSQEGSSQPTDSHFRLRRLTLQGKIDPAFGTNGSIVIQAPGVDNGAASFQILPDQHIIVVMPAPAILVYGIPYIPSYIAARYGPTGTLDTSFGSNGTVNLVFEDTATTMNTVTILKTELEPDGRLTLLGTSGPMYSGRSEFILAQLNADGTLNPTYGDQGATHTPFMQNTNEAAVGTWVLQADHKLIALAQNIDGVWFNDARYHLIRYNLDGSLDSTFDHRGIISLTLAGKNFQAHDLALQADGAIVIAGQLGQEAALVRYAADGTLDLAFGRNGVVTATGLVDRSYFAGLTLQPDGRLLTQSAILPLHGIVTTTPETPSFVVLRYTPSGLLDTSFGTQGRLTRTTTIDDIHLMPDQTIVLAEHSFARSVLTLTALNEGGQLATGFGANGVFTYSTPYPGVDYLLGVSLIAQANRLLVSASLIPRGAYGRSLCCSNLLIRVTPAGALDSTFGDKGVLFTPYGGGVVVTADGIYGGGHIQNCLEGSTLCEIVDAFIWFNDRDGKLDSAKTVWRLNNPQVLSSETRRITGYVSGIAAQPDGTLFVAHQVLDQGSIDVNLIHLIPATHFAKLPVVMR